MNHIKLDNIILRAVNHAERVNDALDCDVIQEAKEQVVNAQNMEEAADALSYLATAINYRKKDAYIFNLLAEYRAELTKAIFQA